MEHTYYLIRYCSVYHAIGNQHFQNVFFISKANHIDSASFDRVIRNLLNLCMSKMFSLDKVTTEILQ